MVRVRVGSMVMVVESSHGVAEVRNSHCVAGYRNESVARGDVVVESLYCYLLPVVRPHPHRFRELQRAAAARVIGHQ